MGSHGEWSRVFDPARALLLAPCLTGPPVTRIGCTGHRALSPGTRRSVAAAIADVLAAEVDDDVTGLTSLAEGADQIFAFAVLSAGGQVHAIIPSEGYEQGFSSSSARATYTALLDLAGTTTTLPFTAPDEDAYPPPVTRSPTAARYLSPSGMGEMRPGRAVPATLWPTLANEASTFGSSGPMGPAGNAAWRRLTRSERSARVAQYADIHGRSETLGPDLRVRRGAGPCDPGVPPYL